MEDFVFGTLATDELRTQLVRNRRAGVTHAHARQPIDPLPGQPVSLTLTVGPAHPFDLARVEWLVDENPGFQEEPGFWNTASMELVDVTWNMLVWGYVRRFSVTLPGLPDGSILRYKLTAYNTAGEELCADNATEYACYVANDPCPEWTREAVIYQVFVDRFFPGKGKEWLQPEKPSGFYGGTLKGVTEKLDYIAELGANVIWLTPIFPSPSHHGYDATDLFDIEPRLGTKADFRELLDQAHARDLRVLLDYVPNHWSRRHLTFKDATNYHHSPYRDWYTFTKWPDKYESFFGVRDLPQINLNNPAARHYMLKVVKHWLEFGVDGYRVDYAVGPTPGFWADFRYTTRATRPDSWTFGEVVEPSESQRNFEGGLDGCLDFILLEGLRQAFAFGKWDAAHLADFLIRHEAYFPPGFSRPSFLDNHDMNRFLWAASNNKRRLRLAALCQFTLSGPPVIYYGTEVGLSQQRDVRQEGLGLPEEARLPMPWESLQDQKLFAYYRNLIALRREHPALRQPGLQILHAAGSLLAYQRGELIVCLNLANHLEVLDLPVPTSTTELILEANSSVLLESDANGNLQMSLPAWGGAVIKIKSSH
jgi:glycosidase